MTTAIANRMNGELEELDREIPAVPVSVANDQVDAQIATAHRFPRSVKRFRMNALTMATLDEETAVGCFYSLKRAGKPIEGPSIRLAEICLSCWGNLRAEASVVEVGDTAVTAEAMVWDLETNTAIKVQTRRRITDKNNRRYSDDMINVTGNAAAAIALRNAAFKVIPLIYIREIERQAREVAIGNAETLDKRRHAMLGYFAKMGVDTARLCAYVGKASVDDLTLEDVFTLRGVANAIKDGEAKIDDMFPQPKKTSLDAVLGKPTDKPASPPQVRGDLTPDEMADLYAGAEAAGIPGLALQSTLQTMFKKDALEQLTTDEGKRLRSYLDTRLE